MPIVQISDQTINTPTWRRVEDGETIRWFYQKFVTEENKWKITSMPLGTTFICHPMLPYAYRAPNSGVAWVMIIVSIVGRWVSNFCRKIKLT